MALTIDKIISAGTTVASLGDIVFSNSNGVSFGANGQTITASHNGLTSQSNQAFSAEGGSSTFQTLIFTNSNGFSFSNTGGSLWGSYTVPSTAGLLSAINISGGTTSNNLSAITFNNSNGISFGLNGSTLTATVKTDYQTSGAYLTTAMLSNAVTISNVNISAGTTSNNLSNFVFSNSNGISFGLNGSTVTATVQTNYLTTAMASNRESDFVQATASFAGTNASGTIASNGISISVLPPDAGVAIKGSGTYIQSTGTVEFANSNGITFGLSNNGTMTASHNGITTQTNQNISLYALGNTTQNSSTVLNASNLSFNAIGSLTIGYSNNSIQLSAPNALTTQTNQTQSNVQGISAGTQVGRTGDIVFSNSNGISFGMSGSNTITASYTVPSTAGLLSAINVSAGTTSNNLSAITFSDSNGVSFGLNGSVLTGTVQTNYLTNWNISGGTTSSNITQLKFVDSFGVSWSLDTGRKMYGSVKTDYDLSQNSSKYIQNWKITGNTSGTTSSAQGTDLWLAGGNGVTISGSSNTLSFSVATNYQSQGAYLTTAMLSNAATISNINFSAGTTSNNLSALTFSNSNGISFGLDGSTVTASYTVPSTVGFLSAINLSAGTTSNNLSAATFSNSNGISFGMNGSVITATVQTNYLTTAMQSNAATISNINVSGGTTSSNLSNFKLIDSNGVSWSLDTGSKIYATVKTDYQSSGAYLITAMLSNAVTISNINISGGTTSSNLSNFKLIDSNGVSWSVDTGSKIYATVATNYQSQGAYLTTAALSQDSSKYAGTGLTTAGGAGFSGTLNTAGLSISIPSWLTTADLSANSSNYFRNWKLTGNTAGTTSSAQGTDLWMAGGNGVTISGSSNTLSFSVATNYQSQGAYLTTAMQSNAATISNVNISAGTTSNNLSAFVFSNSNNVSFGLNGSTFTASATQASSQDSNNYSAGTTSNNLSNIIFSNSNRVSFGLNGSTITAQHALNFSAGTTSNNISDGVTFSNSNRVSFGMNGSTITAQHALNFSGGTTSNDISDQIVFSNSNGISFGLNGSTMTARNLFISSYENLQPFVSNITLTFNAASVSHAVAFNLPNNGSFSFLRVPCLMTTNSTTLATTGASLSASVEIYSTWNAVVYSLGVGASSKSLQSVASGSNGWTWRQSVSYGADGTSGSYTQGFSANVEGAGTTRTTQYTVANTNMSFTTNQIATEWSSARWIDINFANSLSAGNYWLVYGISTSSASNSTGISAASNCNVRYSNHYGASQANIAFGIMGSTNLTSGGLMGAGSFSTAGGGTTNSIPISAISSFASNLRPYIQLLRSA